MSIYKGTTLLSGVATNTISNAHTLLDYKWVDHQLNDQSWLRADTFSWQDGTVYSDAYNHLVDEFLSGQLGQSETIAGITIYYNLAPDGHKIVDASYPAEVQHVEDIYNATGVAWYYILDTANQRFKLPRTKYGFVGLRDTVGKYVPESLPNIKGSITSNNWAGDASSSSALYPSGNGPNSAQSGSGVNTINIDASRYSSTYQDNAPVQQRATQMYLYFYVGQFSQSATEQTAGLNSELFNGKVDLNAANLSTQGKSLISGLGMPSDRYIDLTLGASSSTYTAPANGWFCFYKTANGANQYVLLQNTSSANIQTHSWTPVNGGGACVYLPVKAGDMIRADYNAGGSTNYFRFIYAEGESNV